MFMVGDVHQGIYDNHVSLTRVGIDVRGRSKRLTGNYRTTQEILALAVPALGKASVTGLDDEADTLTGYRSPLHGRRRPPVALTRARDHLYISCNGRPAHSSGKYPLAAQARRPNPPPGKVATVALIAARVIWEH